MSTTTLLGLCSILTHHNPYAPIHTRSHTRTLPTYTYTHAYTAQITILQDIGVLSSTEQERSAPWFIGYASLPTCEQAGSRPALDCSGMLG